MSNNNIAKADGVAPPIRGEVNAVADELMTKIALLKERVCILRDDLGLVLNGKESPRDGEVRKQYAAPLANALSLMTGQIEDIIDIVDLTNEQLEI